MAQGTRVSSNLLHDNDNVDLFVEVNHGPYVVDNNIFLSTNAIQDWSEGGAYAHNIIGGALATWKQGRRTPFFKPHTTEWVGIDNIEGGDDRFYSNAFTGSAANAKWAYAFFQPKFVKQLYGLNVYDSVELKTVADGNVYTNGAIPGSFETNAIRLEASAPQLQMNDDGSVSLVWSVPEAKGKLINSSILGKAKTPQQRFENADGSALVIDRDYFGKKRSVNPAEGPFEGGSGFVVWPKVASLRSQ